MESVQHRELAEIEHAEIGIVRQHLRAAFLHHCFHLLNAISSVITKHTRARVAKFIKSFVVIATQEMIARAAVEEATKEIVARLPVVGQRCGFLLVARALA